MMTVQHYYNNNNNNNNNSTYSKDDNSEDETEEEEDLFQKTPLLFESEENGTTTTPTQTTQTTTTPSQTLQSALQSSKKLYKYKSSNKEFNLPPSIFTSPISIAPPAEGEEEENEKEEKESKPEILLHHNQLESIRRLGHFTKINKGNLLKNNEEVYEFKLFGFNLIRGRVGRWGDLHSTIALSARLLLIYTLKLLTKIKTDLKQLLKTLYLIFDLIIGLGNFKKLDIEKKIQFERCKFLVAELRIPKDNASKNNSNKQSPTNNLAQYVKNQIELSKQNYVHYVGVNNDEQLPDVCYVFTTPHSTKESIDLRLFNRSTFTKIQKILNPLIEKVNKKTISWFHDYREKILKFTKDPFEVNELMMREQMRRLFELVEREEGFFLKGNLSPLLLQQILLHNAISQAQLIYNEKILENFKSEELKRIKNKNSILSLDKIWMEEKLKKSLRKFGEKNLFLVHEIAIEKCTTTRGCGSGSYLGGYFLRRDLAFLRDTAPALRKELNNQKNQIPNYKFEWDLFFFSVVGSSSLYPLWRLQNIIFFTLQLFTQILQKISILLTNSQLSLRNVFLHSNGEYRTVAKEVKRIKVRHFNLRSGCRGRFIGIFKMVFVTILCPLTTIIINLILVTIATLTFLWAPLLSLTNHIISILLVDLHGNKEKFPIFKLIFSFLYHIASMTTNFILLISCPIISFFIFLYTCLKFTIATATDYAFLKILIINNKIPPTRRPDNNNKKIIKIYKLNNNQALLILRNKLEQLKLKNYYQKTLEKIQRPLLRYEDFFNKNLQKFSCSLNESIPGYYRDLVRETINLKVKLDEEINFRKLLCVNFNLRNCVRVDDLRLFCSSGVAMVKDFFENNNYFNSLEEKLDFFESKGIDLGDYENLFFIFCVEVMGVGVFYSSTTDGSEGGCGGEEMDRLIGGGAVKVEINGGVPLSKDFTITKVDFDVHEPFLVSDCYSPFYNNGSSSSSSGNGHHYGSLLHSPQQLPLLHPTFINILIHNRECRHGEEIDIDSNGVVAIINSLGDSLNPRNNCSSHFQSFNTDDDEESGSESNDSSSSSKNSSNSNSNSRKSSSLISDIHIEIEENNDAAIGTSV